MAVGTEAIATPGVGADAQLPLRTAGTLTFWPLTCSVRLQPPTVYTSRLRLGRLQQSDAETVATNKQQPFAPHRCTSAETSPCLVASSCLRHRLQLAAQLADRQRCQISAKQQVKPPRLYAVLLLLLLPLLLQLEL